MNYKRFWEEKIIWVLIFWLGISLIIRPGWLILGGGVFIWFLLFYFSAPGVFWNLMAVFNVDPQKSECLMSKAISYQPASPQPYINLAILKAKQKQWQEAVELFEEAKEKPGKQLAPRFQNLLAVCYRETGKYEKALALIENLIKNGYTNEAVHFNRAFTHFKAGNLPDALLAAEKARTFNISATEPVLLLGKIHFAMGDYQLAKDDYEWSIAHTSWPVESYFWLGRCELALGMIDEAVSHLELAVQRITDDPLLSDVPVGEAQEWLAQALTLKKSEAPV